MRNPELILDWNNDWNNIDAVRDLSRKTLDVVTKLLIETGYDRFHQSPRNRYRSEPWQDCIFNHKRYEFKVTLLYSGNTYNALTYTLFFNFERPNREKMVEEVDAQNMEGILRSSVETSGRELHIDHIIPPFEGGPMGLIRIGPRATEIFLKPVIESNDGEVSKIYIDKTAQKLYSAINGIFEYLRQNGFIKEKDKSV